MAPLRAHMRSKDDPVLKKATLCAVIPCLNEEKNIGPVLDKLKYLGVTPIVVDDGSVDKTADIAESKGAIVIRHSENRGVGLAMKTGYVYAMDSFDDNSIVLVVAGDGQHDPLEIPNIANEIKTNKADYVVGERFSKNPLKFGMPPLNYVFGKLLNHITRIITGIHVEDSTCGFTAIKMSALKRLKLDLPARAAVPNEILVECASNRIRVAFVPITPTYGKKSRISKLTFLRNVLKIYLRYIISQQ